MRSTVIRCDVCQREESGPEVPATNFVQQASSAPVGWLSLHATTGRVLARRPDVGLPSSLPTRTVRALTLAVAPSAVEDVEAAARDDLAELRAEVECAADRMTTRDAVNLEATGDVCPACLVDRPADVVAVLLRGIDEAAQSWSRSLRFEPDPFAP